MSTSAPKFRHFLSPAFTRALADLAESPQGNWWRDVLLHRDLVLAIRRDALNVYNRGGSVFRVSMQDGRPVAETHIKYLVRQRQAYAPLGADGRFLYNPRDALWTSYEGPATLGDMLAATTRLAGVEKAGLHELIKSSPRVIDVEINFRSGQDAEDDLPSSDHLLVDGQAGVPVALSESTFDRLDAATLEERDGQLWVVFHEAKHFANVELRAGPNRAPKVAKQIERYRRSIAAHADEIKASYLEVCIGLEKVHAMRLSLQSDKVELPPLDPLIRAAAGGEPLQVDPEPRLIVFGFDKDQREGAVWRMHRDRLSGEFGLTVYAIGNPTRASSAAFTMRQ